MSDTRVIPGQESDRSHRFARCGSLPVRTSVVTIRASRVMRTLGIIAATVSLTVMLATPALPQAQGYETSVQPVRPTLDTVTKELESALKSNGRTPPPSKLPMTSQIGDVELSTLECDTAPKPLPVPQPQPNNPPPKPVPPPAPSPPPGPAPFLKRPSLEKY